MIYRKYQEILKKLEEGITGKENLELAKSLLLELTNAYDDALKNITIRDNERIDELENEVNQIEIYLGLNQNDEIVSDDAYNKEDESDFEISESIKCPYCGYEFLVKYNEENSEAICPHCKNIIELDWEDFEDDM